MKKLVIATRNKGKIKEIQFGLEGLPFEVIGLEEVGVAREFEVEEPAMTMEGNAIIKAMMYGRKTGLLTLSDDAGLEVDALNGAPGVLSARYAPGTDEDRYRKLLQAMEGVADESRGAQFRAVVAIYDPATDKIRTCTGVRRGIMLREPRGTQGFGYDPIFFDPEFQRTFAEMTTEEKHAVSHRGIALEQARVILAEEF